MSLQLPQLPSFLLSAKCVVLLLFIIVYRCLIRCAVCSYGWPVKQHTATVATVLKRLSRMCESQLRWVQRSGPCARRALHSLSLVSRRHTADPWRTTANPHFHAVRLPLAVTMATNELSLIRSVTCMCMCVCERERKRARERERERDWKRGDKVSC